MLTWHACAKPVPSLNRADMLGGSDLENWLASSMTCRHNEVASITFSVVNSFKLDTDSFRVLKHNPQFGNFFSKTLFWENASTVYIYIYYTLIIKYMSTFIYLFLWGYEEVECYIHKRETG